MTWQVASLTLLALAIAAGFGWYERSHPSAKVLALVAALAALAVVGRLAFAPFPNVKPTTDIVFLSGYALGGAPGFCVGAVAALVSNLFFGHGPWTPWQMAAWGGAGAAGALLARLARGRDLKRVLLALACGVAALGFGLVMDLYLWTLAPEQTLSAYLGISATSLPFNVAHVVASVGFCLVIGPPLVRAVHRYRRRLEVRWPAPTGRAGGGRAAAPLATGVAALAAAGCLWLAPAAQAGTGEAAAYLARAQNRDGGFGASPGDSSNQLYTGWAALGLAAAGRNPLDVTTGGRSVIDFIRRGAGSLDDTGDLSRSILVLEASGLSSRSFAGRDLVAQLRSRERADGSYDGLVNQTASAMVALRAAGVGGLGDSARWIAKRQNGDGGFGFNAGQSSPDVTGQVLQGLAVAGRRGSGTVDRALGYLKDAQRRDGGFGQYERAASNVQSTAFVAQGLVAVGKSPEGFGKGGGGPLAYIRRLQVGDGSFRYARGNGQTPVWVTAQAIPALEREAFPLRALGRAGGRGRGAGSGARGGDVAAAGAGGSAAGQPGAKGAGSRVSGPGSNAASRRAAAAERRKARKGGRGTAREDASATELAPKLAQEVEPGPAGETAPADERDSGSVLGGLIAAVSSAVVVLGLRRRLARLDA